MEQLIGLIVSIALIVISSVSKKKVAEQAQKVRKDTVPEVDQYTVELEDILAEDAVQHHEERLLSPLDSDHENKFEVQEQFLKIEDDQNSKEDFRIKKSETKVDNKQIVRRKWDMAQAVVVSEIIRKPRALRSWPNR